MLFTNPLRRLTVPVTACLLAVPVALAESANLMPDSSRPAAIGMTRAEVTGPGALRHLQSSHSAGVFTGPRAAATSAPQRASRGTARPATTPTPVAPAVRPRTKPGHVTTGHYLRKLNGRATDRLAMYRLGQRDAARNVSGTHHHVLLDIGGQMRGGVKLSATQRFISYAALVKAVVGYVEGYDSRQRSGAPATISVGTSNDLLVSAAHGKVWATQVVNPVLAKTADCDEITIAGANDIEPGFRGGPRASRAWLRGYLANTTAPFVFNGSADGCSTRKAMSHCNNGWTARDLAVLAGAMAPSRIMALPQIYNSDMAKQWAQISRTARLLQRPSLRIVGPLTETAACGRDRSCPTMASHRAFTLLRKAMKLARVSTKHLVSQVDLDVR